MYFLHLQSVQHFKDMNITKQPLSVARSLQPLSPNTQGTRRTLVVMRTGEGSTATNMSRLSFKRYDKN